MDPLTFTVIATAIAGLFLTIWSFFRYKRTKDILWFLVLIAGVIFIYCSVTAFKQKRTIEHRLVAEHPAP